MATLTNSTGSAVSTLNVTYDLATGVTPLHEEVPGHRLYYSISGAAGSWVAVGNYSVVGPQNIPVDLSASPWPDATQMYLLFADDNATSNPDGAYQIDNFKVTVPLSMATNNLANAGIPDGTPVGMMSTLNVSAPLNYITNVTVTLNVAAGYNGDLYAYLVHGSGFAVLLNRVGRNASLPYGYSDAGINVTLDDNAGNGDIHGYRSVITPSGPLTGTWAPDGRNSNPLLPPGSDSRNNLLNAFHGLDPNGDWTLFIADVDEGGISTLVSWGLNIQGTFEPPTITCPAPVFVSANYGQCYASSVSLGTPTFTGLGATVANDAPLLFPVGATVVTWTVTDRFGNAATCPQLVTVTAPAPQPANDALGTMANTAQVVPVFKLLANDTHPLGKAMQLTGVTASGLGSTVVMGTANGQAIVTYTPPLNYVGSDAFIYTNMDTCGVAAVGIVNVTITSGGAFLNRLSATSQSVGANTVLRIVAWGIPGATYTLQQAPNVTASASWTDLFTATAGTNGADMGRVYFNVTNPPDPSFYRTKE